MWFVRKLIFIILEGFFDRNSQLYSILLICWQDVFRVTLFYFTKEEEHIFGFPSSVLQFMAVVVISVVPGFSEEEVDV